jgi:hypothetical protein
VTFVDLEGARVQVAAMMVRVRCEDVQDLPSGLRAALARGVTATTADDACRSALLDRVTARRLTKPGAPVWALRVAEYLLTRAQLWTIAAAEFGRVDPWSAAGLDEEPDREASPEELADTDPAIPCQLVAP